MYVHNIQYVHIFAVSLVIDVQVIMITPENAPNATHSITVNCSIHSDVADMCVLKAMANGQTTITGNH